MCITIAGFSSGVGNLFPQTEGFGYTFGLGLFNGILYLAGFILLKVNVNRNGVVMSSAFMKLGVLVPTMASIVIFGEVPGLFQVIGFGLAVLAIILINFEKEQERLQEEYENYQEKLYNKTQSYIKSLTKKELVDELSYILDYAPDWVYNDFVRRNDIE